MLIFLNMFLTLQLQINQALYMYLLTKENTFLHLALDFISWNETAVIIWKY